MRTAAITGASVLGAVLVRAALFAEGTALGVPAELPGSTGGFNVPPTFCSLIEGSRLQGIPTSSPDGMRTFATATFFDFHYMVNCTARASALDGRTYCVPVDAAFGGDIVFRDAYCQVPFAHFAPTQPPARFVGVPAPGASPTSGPLAALYEVDQATTTPGPQLYTLKSDGSCVASEAFPPDDPFFFATPIDLTGLVELTSGHGPPETVFAGRVCGVYDDGSRLKTHTVTTVDVGSLATLTTGGR